MPINGMRLGPLKLHAKDMTFSNASHQFRMALFSVKDVTSNRIIRAKTRNKLRFSRYVIKVKPGLRHRNL